MTIDKHADKDRHLIEIRVTGEVNGEGGYGIFQHAIVEAHDAQCRELILDLRQASLGRSPHLFRLQSLIQIFKTVILRKDIRVTVLVSTDASEQWTSMDRAAEFDGITLRSCTSRQAAHRYLDHDLLRLTESAPPGLVQSTTVNPFPARA